MSYSPVSQPLPWGARGATWCQGVRVLIRGARVNILLQCPRPKLGPIGGRGLGTWEDTGVVCNQKCSSLNELVWGGTTELLMVQRYTLIFNFTENWSIDQFTQVINDSDYMWRGYHWRETNYYSRGDTGARSDACRYLISAPAATTYDFSTKKSFTFSHSHPITVEGSITDYKEQYLQSCLGQ